MKWLILLCLGCATAPKSAELAQQLVHDAHAAAEAGQLERGAKLYDAANEYVPNRRLLFNVAQLRRKAGHDAEAKEAYRRFLETRAESPSADDAKMDEEARRFLDQC